MVIQHSRRFSTFSARKTGTRLIYKQNARLTTKLLLKKPLRTRPRAAEAVTPNLSMRSTCMLQEQRTVEHWKINDNHLPSLLIAERLQPQHVEALLCGKTLAVRVPNFYPSCLAEEFTQSVLCNPTLSGYGIEPNILRTGIPLCDTVGKPELRQQYFQQSMDWMHEEIVRFKYRLSPINLLLMELHQIWLPGVQFEHLDGHSMWAGSARVFRNGAEALPHRDKLQVDAPEFERSKQLIRQIAANIYTNIPESGGQLDLWWQQFSEEEYNQLRVPGCYGLERQKLSLPTCTIEPQVGDLILFDSTCVHAVRPSLGVRVTQSCFMGLRGLYMPVSMWS